MEKISTIFGFGASGADFNPLLLFPVVIVVCGAVAVFLFGFKKNDTPKFRRINENSISGSSANNNISGSLKRKKRKNISPELAAAIVTSSDRISSEPTQANSKSRDLKSVGAARTSKKESREKKLNVSAKVTITRKAAAKNLKNQNLSPAVRPTEIIGLNNEGEWQTVIKKKQKTQKKEQVTDLLIQAVAEASSKTKKNKQTSVERIINVAEPTAIAVNKKNNNNGKKYEKSTIHREENLQQPHEKTAESTLDAIAVTIKPNLEYNNSVIIEAVVPDVVTANNLVFDELADAAWTENKPQRRNRRALRE